MPKLLLDFDGVNLDGGFEPIPAGIYEARVDTSESEVRKSQNGNDILTITYVIENHPEYKGRKVFENYALTKKALWKLGQVLRAIGVLPPGATKISVDTREWHGKPCKIKVSQETYNDKVRNRVDSVMPITLEENPVKRRIAF